VSDLTTGCRLFLLLLVCLSWAQPAVADTVYPARLELEEVEPGRFDVRFNLPVQNQMVVKATPVLPPVCVEPAPRQIASDPTEYAETWKVDCAPESLIGETIGVTGLLGSSVDVLLSITTLDGRQYNAVLKPARAMYVVPGSPPLASLIGQRALAGMRRCFRLPGVVLLVAAVVLAGFPRRSLALLPLLGALAFTAGQVLVGRNLLLVPPIFPRAIVLLVAASLAVRLAGGADARAAGRVPVWLAALVVGFLFGGALPTVLPPDGLSRLEQHVSVAGSGVGILAGLALLLLLVHEFLQVLRLIPALSGPASEQRRLGTVVGVVAVGLLVHQLSAGALLRSLWPPAPPAFLLMAVVLGVWAGSSGRGDFLRAAAWGAPVLLAGLVIGAQDTLLPGQAFVVPLMLLAAGVCLMTTRPGPRMTLAWIVALAVLYTAAQAGGFIQANVSKPIARLVGSGAAALVLFVLAASMTRQATARGRIVIRGLGALAVLAAIALSGQAYLRWFNTTVATDFAMGDIRLPLLSLLLLASAMLVWPRRSRIAEHLDVSLRTPVAHRVLLACALFLGGVGTVAIRNPWFTQEAPGPHQAERVLSSLLTNTYEAFNIDDEERLYARLSESVGSDLIDDLYLDSRRRLTSGVRLGAVVTVQDVRVTNVGAAIDRPAGTGTFAYPCEWAVTARVQHLQHVHHRQNSYAGVLTIRIADGKWKIEGVDLESEDRRVVSGGVT
jgi:hypothetical protein